MRLYKKWGWPGSWDRAGFLAEWTLVKNDLEKRCRERINDGTGQLSEKAMIVERSTNSTD